MGLAPKGLSRYQLRCGGFLLPSRFCGTFLWSNPGFAFVTHWFAPIRSGDGVYDGIAALWSHLVSVLSWIGRWIGLWFLIHSGCLPPPNFQYVVIGGLRLLIALTFMVDFVEIWDVRLHIIEPATMIREPIYSDGRFHCSEFWLEMVVDSWIYPCWRLVLSLCNGLVFLLDLQMVWLERAIIASCCLAGSCRILNRFCACRWFIRRFSFSIHYLLQGVAGSCWCLFVLA